MQRELIAKYARAVPRYTSYPTAARFATGVDAATYARWLGALDAGAPLSLYLHLPYCAALCWFCGCHAKVTRSYPPIAAYCETLLREIDLVAGLLGARFPVRHVHWGGGTPNLIAAGDFERLMGRLRARFDVAADAEIAIEIDPRTLTAGLARTLADLGATRASLGVQDFDPVVQRAINRVQPWHVTARAIGWLRKAGIARINLDLMYGLPHQTMANVAHTAELAVGLAPQRLTLFGYAHLPALRRHQRLIDERALPGPAERLAQFEAASRRLVDRGYVAIGLDHFARPDDDLARAARNGRLRRNFQGYACDDGAALIGFGASAIGRLPAGYAQNAVPTRAWRRAIEAGRPATARGIALDEGDRLRASIIERLMCDLAVDVEARCRAFGADPAEFDPALESLAPMVADGLVTRHQRRITVSDQARPMVRLACAAFDRDFDRGGGGAPLF